MFAQSNVKKYYIDRIVMKIEYVDNTSVNAIAVTVDNDKSALGRWGIITFVGIHCIYIGE